MPPLFFLQSCSCDLPFRLESHFPALQEIKIHNNPAFHQTHPRCHLSLIPRSETSDAGPDGTFGLGKLTAQQCPPRNPLNLGSLQNFPEGFRRDALHVIGNRASRGGMGAWKRKRAAKSR